jgi:hypothetical protein
VINDWRGRDQLMAGAMAIAGSLSENSSIASGSGILAMVASEKKRRRSSCHSSCRSSGLGLQILRQCSWGKHKKASTSSRAVSITGTAPGNCLRSISVNCCQWARTCSGFWMTNTAFMATATMSWPALGTWLSRLRRKCTRHRCQEQPWNIRLIAAVKPRWASEITSRVPIRPRSTASQKPAAMSELKN